MKAKYKHTNIIAHDWRALSKLYEDVFECERVLPERHLSGAWLDKGTGIKEAQFSGIHLRLLGGGKSGPTLEIYQYSKNENKLSSIANREGFAHIAFEVDDVKQAMEEVIKYGGGKVGNITTSEVKGVGELSFVYVSDPEGNVIELQAWT
jgi:predicted enzyme related to lactoylglutathione lyase